MRRTFTTLGILLIAAVFIISGSAVAPYVDHYEPAYSAFTTNPSYAEGSPNGEYATVGQNPTTLGILMLDLDEGNEMDPNQLFTVYGWVGDDNVNETYTITIYDQGMHNSAGPWSGYDSADLDFTTPSSPQAAKWRYFEITGTSGITSEPDLIYGPEIDAVGY